MPFWLQMLGLECIFIEVRASPYIFTSIFTLVIALLHIQPLFPENDVKEKQTCAKTCQQKPPVESKEQDNKDCNDKGCNPFVPCSMGSCCYLVESFFAQNNLATIVKQNLPLFNDSRLSNKLSDCWHPPEVI
jgi:hypothetical protein